MDEEDFFLKPCFLSRKRHNKKINAIKKSNNDELINYILIDNNLPRKQDFLKYVVINLLFKLNYKEPYDVEYILAKKYELKTKYIWIMNSLIKYHYSIFSKSDKDNLCILRESFDLTYKKCKKNIYNIRDELKLKSRISEIDLEHKEQEQDTRQEINYSNPYTIPRYHVEVNDYPDLEEVCEYLDLENSEKSIKSTDSNNNFDNEYLYDDYEEQDLDENYNNYEK